MMEKQEMRTKVVQKVEDTLKARDKSGALVNECDFLAGAMAVLSNINILLYGETEDKSMGIIPPLWILYPMSGRSVVAELEKDK